MVELHGTSGFQNICHQVQNIMPAGLLSYIQNIREHQHKWW